MREDEEGATRGERREQKQRRKRRAMRLHGAFLRRISGAEVGKRARRLRKGRGPDRNREGQSS